jgi:DNA modification methylase
MDTKKESAAKWVDIDKVKPWGRNPKRLEQGDIDRMVRSIERFGWADVIVAREADGKIISGHLRHAAAKSLGMAKVPVRYLPIDSAEAHALAVAVTQHEAVRTFDESIGALLADMQEEGIDLDGLGWSEDELRDIIATGQVEELEPEDPEDVPEVATVVHSVKGEVYELGPHRLVCGDCRDFSTVEALLAGSSINVAFTSPPYASQRKYDESSGFKPIPPDEYVDWFEDVQANVRAHLAEDGSWFVNIKAHCEDGQRSLYVMDLATAHVRRWAWRFVDELAWLRTGIPGHPMQMGRKFKNGFESVFHFAAGLHKMRPDSVMHESNSAFAYSDHDCSGTMLTEDGRESLEVTVRSGMAYPSNVIDARGLTEGAHTAAFPVSLPAFFIKAFSDSDDIIFDPFMGSGTTMMAAAEHGRVAVGCEISPRYCDLIRRRWTRYAKKNGLDAGPGALEDADVEA